MTLLPPTALADLDPVIDHLQAVARRHEPFEVELRGTGTFRPLSRSCTSGWLPARNQSRPFERDAFRSSGAQAPGSTSTPT